MDVWSICSGVRKKIEEIKKQLKRAEFDAAIHVEAISLADQINLKDLRQSSCIVSYLGFSTEIDWPTFVYLKDGSSVDDYTITERFIMDMLQWHKEEKKIHIKFVYIILIKIIRYLRTLPNVIDVNLPEGDQNTFRVCGDVHGQYYDFINIFNLFGYPSASAPYLFNGTCDDEIWKTGDFTDRGNFSVEVALTCFCYKLVKPDSFYLLRGNHESPVGAINLSYA